jgi:hypothetical protein
MLPILFTGWGLVFKQQYLEFTTSLERGSALYGLGESIQQTGLRLLRNGRVGVSVRLSDWMLWGKHLALVMPMSPICA